MRFSLGFKSWNAFLDDKGWVSQSFVSYSYTFLIEKDKTKKGTRESFANLYLKRLEISREITVNAKEWHTSKEEGMALDPFLLYFISEDTSHICENSMNR